MDWHSSNWQTIFCFFLCIKNPIMPSIRVFYYYVIVFQFVAHSVCAFKFVLCTVHYAYIERMVKWSFTMCRSLVHKIKRTPADICMQSHFMVCFTKFRGKNIRAKTVHIQFGLLQKRIIHTYIYNTCVT